LIHVMAGVPPTDLAYDTALALYAVNLAWAAEKGKAARIGLVIEPLNPRDAPGYLLNTQEQGAAIVAAIGRDRIALQFDIYHCQTAQGDVTTRLEKLMPFIGHMQLADVPGRHEPGTGEIGWEFLFRRIDELGYAGWVGCEYAPLGDTAEGLAWRRRYGVSSLASAAADIGHLVGHDRHEQHIRLGRQFGHIEDALRDIAHIDARLGLDSARGLQAAAGGGWLASRSCVSDVELAAVGLVTALVERGGAGQ